MFNPIFDKPEIIIDPTVFIKAYRVTVRSSEIEWTGLDKSKWFHSTEDEIYLQKSDSPKSHFKTIATLKYNSPNFFLDEDVSFTAYRTEILYYRIISKDKKRISTVFSCEKLHNLYGAEILRRHSIQLKEGHSGNPMYLFIKNRTGARCPDCWDDIRGIRTKSNCPRCLNTGYINSYCDPICMYISLAPEQTAVEQEVIGTGIDGKLQGWTVAYPRINLGDVIVDPATQDIWCVGNVAITTHKRTPTKQEFTLDRHNEDTSIMQLLSKIPKEIEPKNLRHGEFIF